MRERIRAIMRNEGLKPAPFAAEIGFNQSNLSQILKGNRDIPDGLATAILRKYPGKYNPDWLLSGKGTMLNSPQPTVNNTAYGDHSTNMAGSVMNNQDSEAMAALREEIKAKDKQIEDQAEYIKRLLGIIENLSGNK